MIRMIVRYIWYPYGIYQVLAIIIIVILGNALPQSHNHPTGYLRSSRSTCDIYVPSSLICEDHHLPTVLPVGWHQRFSLWTLADRLVMKGKQQSKLSKHTNVPVHAPTPSLPPFFSPLVSLSFSPPYTLEVL